jgi:hypothetical protein
MDIFLDSVGMSEEELMSLIEPLRDPSIWEKDENGTWRARDSVVNHVNDPGVEQARLPLKEYRPIEPTPERISRHCRQLHEQTEYILF